MSAAGAFLLTRAGADACRHPRVGGVLGFIVGGVAGLAIGCAANNDDSGAFCAGQSDTKVAVGGAVGGLVGAWLGATLFRREKWTPVDLDRLRAGTP